MLWNQCPHPLHWHAGSNAFQAVRDSHTRLIIYFPYYLPWCVTPISPSPALLRAKCQLFSCYSPKLFILDDHNLWTPPPPLHPLWASNPAMSALLLAHFYLSSWSSSQVSTWFFIIWCVYNSIRSNSTNIEHNLRIFFTKSSPYQ